MVFQEAGNGQAVFAVALHAYVQAFQTQIEKECVLGGRSRAEIPHQLGSCLHNKGHLTEALGVYDTVIAVIGLAQTGELVRVCEPVKISGIHDASANLRAVTVHILGGGVGNDIRTEQKRLAVDGRSKGVINDERHVVRVGRVRELFNIQNGQCGIGNGLAEHRLGVGTECGLQFVLRAVGGHEGEVDAHLLHRHRKQIVCTAVDGRGGNYVITRCGNIENAEEVGRLTGGGQHSGGTAFQFADLFGYAVTGGIGQTGIEISLGFQIKQLAHILAGVVFERGALIDRDLTGFAVFGGISALYADGFDSLFHKWGLLVRVVNFHNILLYTCFVQKGIPLRDFLWGWQNKILHTDYCQSVPFVV